MNTRAFLSPWKWRRLGWSRIPLLVEVTSSYLVYRQMGSTPLPEFLERLSRASAKKRRDPKELVHVTDWFLQPIHGSSRCMPRAAVLFRMLSRRGFEPTVAYGVSKSDGDLEGHAWVLLGGDPLGELEDPRGKFVETYRYPADNGQ